MSKQHPIPPIRKFMTPAPHTIGSDQTMQHAHEVMRKFRIRHLPVLEGDRLVGVLSDGDLNLVETLRDVDPREVTVAEAMSTDPYTVSPDAPTDAVVTEMARHKYGSVVVMDNRHVVGVFTTNDVCQAFAEMLRTHMG